MPVSLSLDWSRCNFSALRWRTRAFTSRRRSLDIGAVDFAGGLEQAGAFLDGQPGEQRAVAGDLFQQFGGGLQLGGQFAVRMWLGSHSKKLAGSITAARVAGD